MKMQKFYLIKLFLLLVFTLGLYTVSIGQDIVTKDILDRVFLFNYGPKSGTCFYININNNIYLVTARHIFPSSLPNKTTVTISILQGKNFEKIQAKLLVHKDTTVDIAVLDIGVKSDSSNTYRISSNNVILSQECFFLGYPYGFRIEDTSEKPINKGFPIPFVKKAIISGFLDDSRSYNKERRTQLILDGINNPGFSGGPVIIFNKEKNPDRRISVVAVISGYYPEKKEYSVSSNKFVVDFNSGLVITTPIEYVFELIEGK